LNTFNNGFNVMRTNNSAGEKTEAVILQTALALFRRRGFEVTTMRDIAWSAKVATGAAYYYFPSKEAIVAAYYDQVQRLHAENVREWLTGKAGLRERLGVAMHAKLKILKDDRMFLGARRSVPSTVGIWERHAHAAEPERCDFPGSDCGHERERRTAAASSVGTLAGASGHDPVLPL
jgi:AcrR family transcriptional regulator